MAAAFSTDSQSALSKSVMITHIDHLEDEEIVQKYEIQKCVDFIAHNLYKKAALQFPDELLQYSFRISKLIEEKSSGIKVYILGDTSYGSCCVDEVAAEHVKADCIIHFGRACLSPTKRLPVLYVYGAESIDTDNCHEKILEIIPDLTCHIILFHDVVYQHSIERLKDALSSSYSNLVLASLTEDSGKLKTDVCDKCDGKRRAEVSVKSSSNCCGKFGDSKVGQNGVECSRMSELKISHQCKCETEEKEDESIQKSSNHNRFGRSFTLHNDTNLEDYEMLYIGKESLTLTNLMMTYNKNKFYTYDPHTKHARVEELKVSKALMKRYYLIQKAKVAKTVGIVAGTLGVADYLLIIDRLKKMLKQAGKKYYTFMMGKPNVPKMANFMEVDIFVLVACPENSLIDSQEFYKPIITPFEMEVACSRARDWTGEYVTDFRELLPGMASHVDFENSVENDECEEPEFSLISGSLVQSNETKEEKAANNTSDLALRNSETALTTFGSGSAAHYLHSRTWQGLEKKLGETEITTAVEGRKGIAVGYSHETQNSDPKDA